MIRRLLASVAVVASLITSACIDDPAAVDDQFALTQEDAELLGLTFWRHALEVEIDLAVGGQEPSGPQRAPQTFTSTDSTSVACAVGGEIHQIIEARVTIDDETEELSLGATLTLTHLGCREEIEGRRFTFEGAPAIVVDMANEYHPDGTVTISGSLEGAAVVITGGAPLLCDMSVAVDGTTEHGVTTYRTYGTFCGAVIDETDTQAAG